MSNFHILDNGDLLCLVEPYPTALDGYEQDSYHKNTFHPIWDPCKHRSQQIRPCPNGRLRSHTICNLDDTTTNYVKCSGCTLIEPPNP